MARHLRDSGLRPSHGEMKEEGQKGGGVVVKAVLEQAYEGMRGWGWRGKERGSSQLSTFLRHLDALEGPQLACMAVAPDSLLCDVRTQRFPPPLSPTGLGSTLGLSAGFSSLNPLPSVNKKEAPGAAVKMPTPEEGLGWW